MKIPKSLETVRDEQSLPYAKESSSILCAERCIPKHYKFGFDAGVAAVLQSAELKGLARELEYFWDKQNEYPDEETALERWKKFLSEEGSDEE